MRIPLTDLTIGLREEKRNQEPSKSGARTASKKKSRARGTRSKKAHSISQCEIQQNIQRFAGELVAQLSQSLSDLDEQRRSGPYPSPLARAVAYISSVLDIASGPLPESNYLDMIAFTRLCAHAVKEFWIPQVYGAKGEGLLKIFESGEAELWKIVQGLINKEQEKEIIRLIDTWIKNNPGQAFVEWVRLPQFAALGTKVSDREGRQGILAQIRNVTSTVDQATLLAERALFLGQRLPFLLRFHVRLAVREALSEVGPGISGAENLISQATELEPLVRELAGLTCTAEHAVHEAQVLTEAVKPLIENANLKKKISPAQGLALREGLNSLERLTETAVDLVHGTQQIVANVSAVDVGHLRAEVDGIAKRAFNYALALGASFAILGWGGYYVSKRALMSRA